MAPRPPPRRLDELVIGKGAFLGEVAVAYRLEGIGRYLSSWPQSIRVAQANKQGQGKPRG